MFFLTLVVGCFILTEIMQGINSHFYESWWDLLKPIGLVFLCELLQVKSVPIVLFIAYTILGGLCVLILVKKISAV